MRPPKSPKAARTPPHPSAALAARLNTHLGNIAVTGDLDGAKEVIHVIRTATLAVAEVPTEALALADVPDLNGLLPTMGAAQEYARKCHQILRDRLAKLETVLPQEAASGP